MHKHATKNIHNIPKTKWQMHSDIGTTWQIGDYHIIIIAYNKFMWHGIV